MFQCLKKLSPLGNAETKRLYEQREYESFNALKSFHPLVIETLENFRNSGENVSMP